jgi:LDH2 family malate/lactate/ureidoglycolate dehydrogenase
MLESSLMVRPADLHPWIARVFERVGVGREDAAVAADVLVTANLRGIDSHGVLQLPWKIRRVRSGQANPRPQIQVVEDSPAAVLVDGDNGLGMVVGAWAMRLAIERARQYGAAAVTVRRSNHFGIAGYYAQLAAAANQVGICCTNASKAMAPWGSLTPYLSTNPVAIAVPGGIEGGVVLDMATSQVAWGKVELAARAGQKIPLTWATDLGGRPTDDPQVGMQGLMQPLGGYKGSGLALMVDVLCGVLSGAAFGSHIGDFYAEPDRREGVGHFCLAIEISRLMPIDVFKARMAQMVSEIHACQPAEGVERIYVPGEIEMEIAARRQREGIPLPPDVLRELRLLGVEVGEPFPA